MASSNPHSPATQVGRRAVTQPTVSFHTSPCHRDPRPGAWVPGWAGLPVLAGPAALSAPQCASHCLEETSSFQLCRGSGEGHFHSGVDWHGGCSYTRVRAPGWGDRKGLARATRKMALHAHTHAHGYRGLCLRWAVHPYTFLLFCGPLFLPG